MIYEIRGKQVLLDSDLARLYKVETKRINEAVRNNPNKFPERFSWVLTDDEYVNLRSKISTSNIIRNYGGRRYNPRVFTEQGVAMLSTILKSSIAVEVSISIMDAFVSMRHYLSNDYLNQKYYNEMIIRHDSEIKILQESFDKLHEKKKISEIYFNGQIYDAYSKIVDIFSECKNELIIIDGYADKTVLDIVSGINTKIIIITKNKSLLKKIDIEKYNEQYNNLKVYYNDNFHDRYFIIDKKIFYHCGTSLNKIGCRTFSINLIGDDSIKNSLLLEIDKIIKEN